MDKDFFAAYSELLAQKGLDEKVLIDALEFALLNAYKKHSGNTAGNVKIKLDPERFMAKFYATKEIVAEVVDPEKEISLEDAVKVKKSYKVGDTFEQEFIPKDFGRIDAQTAKQIIMQKLREAERGNTIAEFEGKEDGIQTGIIRRVENDTIYVELCGGSQIEGIMLKRDQVPTEKYNVNDKIKVYVKSVRDNGKNAQVLVSRTSPAFVRCLFENEVPEIKQGYVQIKNIAREPGQRTKIAIYSQDKNIDAVGSCVGMRGARVNAIVSELGGEKIDIILWSEDPLEYIAKSLSPAKVLKVTAIEGEKVAKVIVPDDKLSLAIGRSGQNTRLAARLTGWKIDVKSLSKAEQEGETVDIQEEMGDAE